MLWFLVALGLVATVAVVRDLLRRPDPTALPDPLRSPPRGGDHTDWVRAWDGLNGGGTSGSNGGGRV